MKKIMIFLAMMMVFVMFSGISYSEELTINLKVSGVEVGSYDAEPPVVKSMSVQNPEGYFSSMTFIISEKKKAFMKLYAGITTSDVTSFWNDFIMLKETTDIRDVTILISSPGGDAFSGMALADLITNAINDGFAVTCTASGIVASAAVPIFASCSHRIAAAGTIFMVHEAALWKWPGRETASDIRAQGELMNLLQDRYISSLVNHSKLTKEEWENMEGRTTWFSAEQAKEYGVVDEIK